MLDRIVLILLRGIALNLSCCTAAEYSTFQADIDAIRKGFEDAAGEEAKLLVAFQAIRRFEQYNAFAEQIISGQRQQMHNTIELLTDALVTVSHGHLESARSLRAIETELEQVSGTTERASLERKLKGAVAAICAEAERQRQSERKINSSLIEARKMGSWDGGSAKGDALTGLQTAESALTAVRGILESGHAAHVYIFAAERLDAVNLRFGFAAGDQVLVLFTEQLRKRLTTGDRLFRWRGPSFVLVTEKPGARSFYALEASRICSMKLEHTITTGSKESVIPVTGSWSIVHIPPTTNMDEVVRMLNESSLKLLHTDVNSLS